MNEQKCVIIDLQRTIGSGETHYWRARGRGYTTNVHDVGYYPQMEALEWSMNDVDGETIVVSESKFKSLSGIE